MVKDYIKLSRIVSHALRHEPWLYELEIDSEGWTSIDTLISALRLEKNNWQNLSEDDLKIMIERSDKRRYEISDGRIRALYGHSLPEKLEKVAAVPPEILFHGTSPEVLNIIKSEGLKPMKRQYIHLSTNQEMAIQVGKRKGSQPVILTINATKANASGVKFYQGNEMVWLADYIPPGFIE